MLYNLDPLSAMDLYYSGERNGIWNGDFIKNEKQRGLVLPTELQEFLENYGYLDVNRNEDSFRLFHPDDMGIINLQTDIGEVPILAAGIFRDYLVGLRLDTRDLEAAFGERTQDGTMWSPVELTFSGMLATMFVALLFRTEGHLFLQEAVAIDAEIEKYGGERTKILPSEGCPQHFSLNFHEESKAFLIVEFDSQGAGMKSLHVIEPKEFSLEELERLFEKEFYQNSMNCDYRHALDIQTEIIRRMEGAPPLELTKNYKLAARCCWALGNLEEAVAWYEKGCAVIAAHVETEPEQAADYYHAMGNFYADTKQYGESERYYAMEREILKRYFPEDAYKNGKFYQAQASFLAKDPEKVEQAIALYNQALEEFQKDPKGCKYDIARTQQMRGEAKRLKKKKG